MKKIVMDHTHLIGAWEKSKINKENIQIRFRNKEIIAKIENEYKAEEDPIVPNLLHFTQQ